MARGFYTQKIANDDKNEISSYNQYMSLTFVNTHTSSVDIDIWVTSQLSTDITNTGVLAAEDEAMSLNSVTLTVDTVDATQDNLLNEVVYKSDGTLFGTCTTVSSTTSIVFSGGVKNSIANNDALYTGTRYNILKGVTIPNGTALQLDSSDINFDTNDYKLYITSSNASGLIDIITRL